MYKTLKETKPKNGIDEGGTPQLTASPTRRKAITSFRMVESGTPWYGSIQLVEAHRNIPGRSGFDNSERSYGSAVRWARGKLACSRISYEDPAPFGY